MKNKVKFLTIIALLALICFTMIACQVPESETVIPSLTGTISISGIAEVGETLTVKTSSLGGKGTISYQWKRGTIKIGTNSSTYIVQSADVDSVITVTVTRSGYTGSVTSPAIGPIAIIPDGGNISVTFNSVTANGNEAQTTTALTLTFSHEISGLTAGDITLTGVPGVDKGTLIGSETTYTLQISGFTASGTLNVAVAKFGYTINGSPKQVSIFCYIPPVDISVMLNSVTANGSSSQTTTELTLTFDKAITGLSANDIILTGVTGVTKGTLNADITAGTYTLPISGFTAGGTLNVAVAKSGYAISNSSKTVSIYYYTLPTVGIVIDLAVINEWELIEQTAQTTTSDYKYFTVTGTYETYRWYLDGVFVEDFPIYFFQEPAGVYQLVVIVTNRSGESRSGRCRITVGN